MSYTSFVTEQKNRLTAARNGTEKRPFSRSCAMLHMMAQAVCPYYNVQKDILQIKKSESKKGWQSLRVCDRIA
jgi:hypothetical protein